MGKKVTLKEKGGTLSVSGIGDFHDGNLTEEVYERLVAHNKNLAAAFTLTEEGSAEKKPKSAKDKDTNG